MARYTITRACGHVEDVQIFGKVNGRVNQERYEATKLCKACYAEKIAAERATEMERAAQANAGLVELIGSEKQVSWAEQIRAKMMPEINKALEIARGHLVRGVTDAQAKMINAGIAKLESVMADNNAGRWIERRNETIKTLLA